MKHFVYHILLLCYISLSKNSSGDTEVSRQFWDPSTGKLVGGDSVEAERYKQIGESIIRDNPSKSVLYDDNGEWCPKSSLERVDSKYCDVYGEFAVAHDASFERPVFFKEYRRIGKTP